MNGAKHKFVELCPVASSAPLKANEDRLSSVVWDEPWAAISAYYLNKAEFMFDLAESENRIDVSLNFCYAGNSQLRLT